MLLWHRIAKTLRDEHHWTVRRIGELFGKSRMAAYWATCECEGTMNRWRNKKWKSQWKKINYTIRSTELPDRAMRISPSLAKRSDGKKRPKVDLSWDRAARSFAVCWQRPGSKRISVLLPTWSMLDQRVINSSNGSHLRKTQSRKPIRGLHPSDTVQVGLDSLGAQLRAVRTQGHNRRRKLRPLGLDGVYRVHDPCRDERPSGSERD